MSIILSRNGVKIEGEEEKKGRRKRSKGQVGLGNNKAIKCGSAGLK